MASSNYTYISPETTYTLNQFIACQNKEEPSYYNLSFKDEKYYDYIDRYLRFVTYNVIWDYLDDIRKDYALYTIDLSDKEMMRYKYRPKLLAFDIYGDTELAHMILLINDMYSFKQFVKNRIKLPDRNSMSKLCQELFNANQSAIKAYNS